MFGKFYLLEASHRARPTLQGGGSHQGLKARSHFKHSLPRVWNVGQGHCVGPSGQGGGKQTTPCPQGLASLHVWEHLLFQRIYTGESGSGLEGWK